MTISIDNNNNIQDNQGNTNDRQQEDIYYHNSCQEILLNIISVKSLIEDLQQSKQENIYHPSSALKTIQITQQQHEENILQKLILNEKLNGVIRDLNNLTTRVSDTSSKVLVTGDLNSGKSTLVNALLQQEQDLLPVDQQPCTSIFCEIVYSPSTEGVHAIQDTTKYNQNDKDTFHLIELRHLYKLLTEEYDKGEQEERYKLLKIYTNQQSNNSLLHNGVIDISFIDSPGLNTDSIQTTSIFARQEEIDVVVFVVSAENHFTLSGKEFLQQAANERTHIFIVVNRFDHIRDKERCKRLILEQIQQLSPATFENADELVHFVSSKESQAKEFIQLQTSLHSFVLTNRTQSKLLPAKNYLVNVLGDVYRITKENEAKWMENVDESVKTLEKNFLPGYSHLLNIQEKVKSEMDSDVEAAVEKIQETVSNALQTATSQERLTQLVESVQFPGLFSVCQYAQDMVDLLSTRLQHSLQQVETEANHQAIDCMNKMNTTVYNELVKGCATKDITTQVHKDMADNIKNCRPKTIKIEARDLLLKRRLVDDKKVALSCLITVGATVTFFKVINLKELVWSILSSYLNPLDDGSSSNLPSYQTFSYACMTIGILGVGWTAWSFVSVIPRALRNNIKHKFDTVIQNEKFCQHQTHRITQNVHNLLQAKQTEIEYRIKEIVQEKEQEKKWLENNVLQAKLTHNYFKQLSTQSNTLLEKVEQSLLVK